MVAGTLRARSSTSTKIRLLLCSANTGDSAQHLRTEAEIRAIVDALSRARMRDCIDPHVSLALTPARFVHELDDFSPAIVHFGGHGTPKGGLVFLGERPDVEASVDASLVARLFGQLRARPHLVVFAACYSLETAVGVSRHVDFAIGFDGAISDDAARVFSASLYERLAAEDVTSVEHAFALAKLASVMSGHSDAEQAALFSAGLPCYESGGAPRREGITLSQRRDIPAPKSRLLLTVSSVVAGVAAMVTAAGGMFYMQTLPSQEAGSENERGAIMQTNTNPGVGFALDSTRWSDRAQDVRACPSGTSFVQGGQFGGRVVDDLCFDITEVIVSEYRECVDAGFCTEPTASVSTACNYLYNDRGRHPVNCVDWVQAVEFCRHVGKRLPTEWEWEWVARGRDEARAFPWGEESPSCLTAVWSEGGDGCGMNHTWPVGSKPLGDSRDGIKDMVGNVWEWTSSSEGGMKRLRGGGWISIGPDIIRAGLRYSFPPSTRDYHLGFRCTLP